MQGCLRKLHAKSSPLETWREWERLNAEARRQAETHEGAVVFDNVDDLMEYLRKITGKA